MRLRTVFCGTPEFAVPSLRVAAEYTEVLAVYTQPDRPAGRGRALQPSPVKEAALELGIEVRQPQTLRAPVVRKAMAALQPDLIVTAAYGLIFTRQVLAIARLGCWNVHASLLPRWRGAAPIQRAVEAGDAEAGVCIMRMEEGLDTGPVYRCGALPVGELNSGELHDRLAVLGADLLATCLAEARDGNLREPTPQPAEGVSHAAKLDKAEARLDWSLPALVLARKVRAFHPWPVAEATLLGERVRIHAAELCDEAASTPHVNATPGEVLTASRDGIDVATGDGVLRLKTLQREGGKPMPATDYRNARRDAF